MKPIQKNIAVITLPILGLFLALEVWHEIRELRESGRAKVTESNIQQLNEVLKSAQVTNVSSAEGLRMFFRQAGYPDYTRDGWGRDILIETRADSKGNQHYTLRSLGRDGKKSDCCKRQVRGEWDMDALWVDDRWLQVW